MAITIFGRTKKQPEFGLERGWQFYSRPNNLEPVGFVFRIDEHGVRYPVTQLDVASDEGVEVGIRIQKRMEVKMGAVARFLQLIDLNANANVGQTRVLEFEIQNPIRTRCTDLAIDAAMKDFLHDFVGKKGHRYFVIRETRSASGMTFRLSKEQLAELGGKGKVTTDLKAGGELKVNQAGIWEISQPFPERLLVTFLPDQITRLKAGLAEEGAFGLAKTIEPLEWQEPDDA